MVLELRQILTNDETVFMKYEPILWCLFAPHSSAQAIFVFLFPQLVYMTKNSKIKEISFLHLCFKRQGPWGKDEDLSHKNRFGENLIYMGKDFAPPST